MASEGGKPISGLNNHLLAQKHVVDYLKKSSTFRNWVTADGSSGYKAEKGRYHLYIAYGCPWCHWALALRELKGLHDIISINVTDWILGETGWKFNDKKKNCTPDTENNCEYIREVYELVNPDYQGKYTLPVLWDKHKKTIVNNESSEILRMFNTEFNEFCPTESNFTFYCFIWDEVSDDIIYPTYGCGLATSQEDYERGYHTLFQGLDKAEEILCKQRYLTGSQLTEADVLLFIYLIRFELVFCYFWKCNKKMLVDYPNLWGFVRDIYQVPGISNTTNVDHIKKMYMESHKKQNPFGIIAVGPDVDFLSPHGRENM